jgi:hypothetical protein
MVDRKRRVQELGSNIRQRKADPVVGNMKELLALLIDEAKDNLMVSLGDQTLQLQGEAQALSRLLTLLTREPPSIKREGE